MYDIGAQPEPITNETEYWSLWKPHPADQQHPAEVAHVAAVKALWDLRQAHPELRSGKTDIEHTGAGDPAVHAFLRHKDERLSLCAINFRPEAVTCALTVEIAALGLSPDETLSPRDLLTDTALPPCTGADLAAGYEVTIRPRDGVLLKLR